jgi:aminopeptidase N
MENVGCVTYNEKYLYRGETPTLAKKLKFSNTNLHELSHMWFGNLVTMKWWDDLWLNEAFATFMAFLVMEISEATKDYHETTWVAFLEYKFWGIQADSMTSTHPVCANIADTDEAESLFDGISYGKGSSFVK